MHSSRITDPSVQSIISYPPICASLSLRLQVKVAAGSQSTRPQAPAWGYGRQVVFLLNRVQIMKEVSAFTLTSGSINLLAHGVQVKRMRQYSRNTPPSSLRHTHYEVTVYRVIYADRGAPILNQCKDMLSKRIYRDALIRPSVPFW